MANAQNTVHMTCESIWCRISGISEKSKRQAINPDLSVVRNDTAAAAAEAAYRSDIVLFKFFEQYLARLEGPIVIQVWGRYIQLAKEIAGNVKDYKIQSFYALRCLSVLADKITQTTALEDRRIRKEFQVKKLSFVK